MLSSHDDYPIHQTPDPVCQPAVSDKNFYDRYWFNGYARDGEFYFGIALGLYPNRRVMDAGFSIVKNGVQHSLHASRLAPDDPYFEPLDEASYRRELDALRRALQAAEELHAGQGIHVLIHFPPYDSRGKPTPFDGVLREFPVRTVTFGHFHFPEEWERAPQGEIGGIYYTLASADFIDFSPVRLPL